MINEARRKAEKKQGFVSKLLFGDKAKKDADAKLRAKWEAKNRQKELYKKWDDEAKLKKTASEKKDVVTKSSEPKKKKESLFSRIKNHLKKKKEEPKTDHSLEIDKHQRHFAKWSSAAKKTNKGQKVRVGQEYVDAKKFYSAQAKYHKEKLLGHGLEVEYKGGKKRKPKKTKGIGPPAVMAEGKEMKEYLKAIKDTNWDKPFSEAHTPEQAKAKITKHIRKREITDAMMNKNSLESGTYARRIIQAVKRYGDDHEHTQGEKEDLRLSLKAANKWARKSELHGKAIRAAKKIAGLREGSLVYKGKNKAILGAFKKIDKTFGPGGSGDNTKKIADARKNDPDFKKWLADRKKTLKEANLHMALAISQKNKDFAKMKADRKAKEQKKPGVFAKIKKALCKEGFINPQQNQLKQAKSQLVQAKVQKIRQKIQKLRKTKV